MPRDLPLSAHPLGAEPATRSPATPAAGERGRDFVERCLSSCAQNLNAARDLLDRYPLRAAQAATCAAGLALEASDALMDIQRRSA